MKKTNSKFLKRLPIVSIIVAVVAIVLAVPAFIYTRDFVVGWGITNLPGVAVKYNEQGQPQVSSDATVPEDVAAPEQELPSWRQPCHSAVHRSGRT